MRRPSTKQDERFAFFYLGITLPEGLWVKVLRRAEMLPGSRSPCWVIQETDIASDPQRPQESGKAQFYPQELFFLQSEHGIYDIPSLLATVCHFIPQGIKGDWNACSCQGWTSFPIASFSITTLDQAGLQSQSQNSQGHREKACLKTHTHTHTHQTHMHSHTHIYVCVRVYIYI